MTKVWTHGRWTVKPGREDEFVAALADLAREARAEVGASRPTLLRERERPNVFLTFGAWDSIEEIERFRAFVMPRVREMDDLLEGFEVFTLDEVSVP